MLSYRDPFPGPPQPRPTENSNRGKRMSSVVVKYLAESPRLTEEDKKFCLQQLVGPGEREVVAAYLDRNIFEHSSEDVRRQADRLGLEVKRMRALEADHVRRLVLAKRRMVLDLI